MIDESLKDKIAKIYELVNRGGTDGEKAAAKKALDKILAKHNLDESFLNGIYLKPYTFKYATELETLLLALILTDFTTDGFKNAVRTPWKKSITSKLLYSDFITAECMYQYFRRHMKKQWKIICLKELKKCRKSKTRNKRRTELQNSFFMHYIVKSNLVKEENLQKVDVKPGKEMEDYLLLQKVEGGSYKKQVHSHLLIEN